MKLKPILAACLTLVGGLLLAVALLGPPISLADGPPPPATPPGVRLSDSVLVYLVAQAANRPAKPVPMRLDAPGVSPHPAQPQSLALNNSGWQKIMSQDFDFISSPPDWYVLDDTSADGGDYLWGQRDCKALSGTYGLWAGGGGLDGGLLACGQTYANNLETWVAYGPVDLSQVTDAELQFGLWDDSEDLMLGDFQILIDFVFWGVSTNGVNFNGYAIAGQTGDWIPVSLDLADDPLLGDYTGQSSVYLGWQFVSSASNPQPYEGAFIDDAALWTYQSPTPAPPFPTPTLPITRHTTITDFMSGRSGDLSISPVAGGDYGDGALIAAEEMMSIGDWEHLPSLPGYELRRFAAAPAAGHLFVLGGIDLDTAQLQYRYQRSVHSALINEDGSLGRWVEVVPLPQALSNHAVVVANNHLFVLGGLNVNGVQKSVFSAGINPDGSLEAWNQLPDLPKPLFLHTAVATHGYLYVLGGREALEEAIISDTIYRASVNADGSLGDWETLPGGLPAPRQFHAVVASCDHLYLIAGADAVYEWQTVYRSQIHPDGSLGVWSQTTSLPNTLSGPAAAAVRGGILVTGGTDSSDPVLQTQNDVYWAPLGADCDLGDWVELTPLPYSMALHALVTTDDHVYNLGGLNIAFRFFDSVLVAPLQGEGAPVQRAAFNHRFDLGRDYPIESLHWTQEGSDTANIKLRYRVGDAGGVYGPWSAYTSASPVAVNAPGGFLEYEIKFEGTSGLGGRRVTQVSLSIDESRTSVYLPIVLK